MKVKHIFTTMLAAMFVAACSNEEFADVNNSLSGKMMDATNFTLATDGLSGGNASTRVSYYPQYVATGLKPGVVKPVWEADDVIGFSHIYSDQKIITNYRFEIENGVGESNAATFKTDNSTIFEGDYFVYYPFNKEYADYDGIPFSLDAIQVQDAADDAVVKVGMDPTDNMGNNADELATLERAGKHLARFSISDRISAEAKTQQCEFSLNQYTSYIAFLVYPKNQTKDVNIKRIEMVSTDAAKPLNIPVGLRFKAVQGQASPEVDAEKTKYESEVVLLFERVAATGDGGLTIDKNATKENATLAYMSMLPATYAKGSYKFVVYYTENNILKKRDIDGYKDLNIESNAPVFFNIELDANGATEVTDYEIYTETEFASAVAKSNAITNGAATFEIMRDITLTDDYELKSAVPVTFNGGKTVSVTKGKKLTFNSDEEINFNNIISTVDGEQASCMVSKGDVNIQGVNSVGLNITIEKGDVVIKNEEKQGNARAVINKGNLTLENVKLANRIENGNNNKAVLSLKNAIVGATFTNNSTSETASKLENVTVLGNFTNTKGTLDVTGNNVFAYNNSVATPVINAFSNAATMNFLATTTVVGNVTNNGGTLNLAKKANATEADAAAVTAKGTTDLSSGLVYVDAQGTYNAEGALSNLKGNGAEGATSTMILEGTLTTNSTATLSENFKFCGKIVNKTKGSWTLNTYGVYKFDHSHQVAPIFENEGEVIVKTVTDETATAAMGKMAKELYSDKGGRLEWADIKDLTELNDIVKLGAECWASDLCVYATVSAGVITNDLSTALVDWSAKNIIIEVRAGTSTNNPLTAKLGDKQIKAKNLTVKACSQAGGTAAFKVESSVNRSNGKKAIDVAGTLSLVNENEASGPNNTIDLYSAICKDIAVNNKATNDAVLNIMSGLYIGYTGTYTTAGDKVNTAYPNNIPQKVEE